VSESDAARLRVIGLGNGILTDDAVGLHVARAVRRQLEQGAGPPGVDVVEAEVGGFALMELMAGWDAVVLVDAVQLEGVAAGSVVALEPSDLGVSLRLLAPHEIDLVTALAVGDRLGYPMPRRVHIIGIQGADLSTFGEELTPQVQAAVPRAEQAVLRLLGQL